MRREEIAAAVRQFVAEQSASENGEFLRDDTDLIEAGILNSLLMVAMVGYCEETFRCTLETNDLTEDSFRSITAISNLICQKQGATA